MPNFTLAFISSALLSLIITPIVIRLSLKFGVVDIPVEERKIHNKAVPLFGGIAVFIAFVLVVSYFSGFTADLIKGYLLAKHVLGLVLGGLVLIIGGFLDDRYNLKPKYQIIFPILATLIVIGAGIGIDSLTNPITGATVYFDQPKFEIFRINGIPYYFSVIADMFTFAWLMGMMYTTKYLDGLDGLASGVGLIACIIIFFVAQNITLQQDYIALLSIIFAGALAGFLVYNFYPASIFLGEGGSVLIGFFVGVLSILAGSKIATALLVFGIPIADVVWVIGRRLVDHKPLIVGDKLHLHYRLLNIGLSHRGAVLLMYFLTASFGITTLFLQTRYKLYVLGLLSVFMVILAIGLVMLYNKKNAKQN